MYKLITYYDGDILSEYIFKTKLEAVIFAEKLFNECGTKYKIEEVK